MYYRTLWQSGTPSNTWWTQAAGSEFTRGWLLMDQSWFPERKTPRKCLRKPHGPEASQSLPKGSQERQQHGIQSESLFLIFIKARSSCPWPRAGQKQLGPGGAPIPGPRQEEQHTARPSHVGPAQGAVALSEAPFPQGGEARGQHPALLTTAPHPARLLHTTATQASPHPLTTGPPTPSPAARLLAPRPRLH